VLSDLVTSTRYVGHGGWGGAASQGQINPEIPRPLKQQLYRRLVNQANVNQNQSGKMLAMVRLGDFFVQAFGTEASMAEALKWYVKAAELGSSEAMAMVFRLERLLRQSVKDVFPTITTEIRSGWMIECLLSTIKKEFSPELSPISTGFVEVESRMRQVLNDDPWLAEVGLRADLDSAIVKSRRIRREVDNDAPIIKTIGKLNCGGEIVTAIFNDLPEMLDETLQRNSNLETIKPRLLPFAAELGAVRTIRMLASKYHCNVDYVDTASGKRYSSLAEAAIRVDFPVFQALAQCGADYTCLNARGTMDRIIRVGTDLMMREAFNAVLARKVNEPIRELFDEVSMCHQFIDGLCPAMRFMRQATPPDNSNPPPLFEAIMLNRLDKVQSILTRGGNPNVCYQGFTALHFAVRFCRPMAVILLLAFGADPNSRNSSSGYGTPLHELSENLLKPGKSGTDGDLPFKEGDFLMRKYDPLPESEEEYGNQRLLILRLLLVYGARSSMLCIDGFTPLMTAVVSPACSALAVVTHFISACVSLADKGLRDESVIHVCVMARNHLALQKLLPLANVATINSIDVNGATPLFLAAMQKDNRAMIEKLLAAGSDVTIRGLDDLTPLDVAMIEGHISNVMAILDHLDLASDTLRSALLSESPITGRNAFHFATFLSESTQMVEMLSKLLSWTSSAGPILSKDRSQFTPLDYARYQNASSAVGRFQEHIRTHSVTVINRKPSDHQVKTSQASLHSIRLYRERLNSPKGMDETHIKLCHSALEEIGGGSKGQLRLTPAEIGCWKMLDSVRKERGERDPLTIWCMNNLGTGHERYGRLVKAQDILYHGWTLSKQVLGNENLVTKDFANKILRVIRDRGVQGIEGRDVADWQAQFGKDTLSTPFKIKFQSDVSEEEFETFLAHGRGEVPETAGACDREDCSKLSRISCPGKLFSSLILPRSLQIECKFARYCSETCRADDVLDPYVDHLSVCFPTNSFEKSPAAIVYKKHPREVEGLIDRCWSTIKRTVPSNKTLPTYPNVSSVINVDLNPAKFNEAIAYRLKKNSVVVFFDYNYCEARILMRPPLPWKPLRELGMFSTLLDVILCLRPIENAVERAENKEIPFMAVVEFETDFSHIADSTDLVGDGRVARAGPSSTPSPPAQRQDPAGSDLRPMPNTVENARLYPSVRNAMREAASASPTDDVIPWPASPTSIGTPQTLTSPGMASPQQVPSRGSAKLSKRPSLGPSSPDAQSSPSSQSKFKRLFSKSRK
jgi:ankyrin repeat protein